jgi:nucleoid-associated protein YgaU
LPIAATVPIEDGTMQRGVKIVLAAGVLLGGSALALMFRLPARAPVPSERPPADRLVLRGQDETAYRGLDAEAPTAGINPLPSGSRPEPAPWAMPDEIAADEPPPRLARSYPEPFSTPGGWDHPAAPTPLGRPAVRRGVLTHRIIDGDTLRNVAERYLGSADRYVEVYQANRDVLESPDVLPIGAELTIPPSVAEEDRTATSGPLVPVRPPN